MKMITKRAILAFAVLFGASDMNMGTEFALPILPSFVSEADAARVVVRRPVARPATVAGVARRTTRRVVRRTIYVATLPAGCPYGTYYGYKAYYCGGVYYQKSGSTYVVVVFE